MWWKLFNNIGILQLVYTVRNVHGHGMKSDSMKMSVAFKFKIILRNLKVTNHIHT